MLIYEVRKAPSIPDNIPLFTLRGGIDRSKLKGVDKLMISMLTKGLAAQKQRSEQDESMLELLENKEAYDKMANAKNPYGDGHASDRIMDAIYYYFNKDTAIKPKDFE